MTAPPTDLDPRAVIESMVNRIVKRFTPERVILFGSYARGDAGPDSDVDLLVVMPFSGRRVAVAVKMRTALHGMGLAKDVVVVTPEEFEKQKDLVGSLVYPAVQEGRVVYERHA